MIQKQPFDATSGEASIFSSVTGVEERTSGFSAGASISTGFSATSSLD